MNHAGDVASLCRMAEEQIHDIICEAYAMLSRRDDVLYVDPLRVELQITRCAPDVDRLEVLADGKSFFAYYIQHAET